MCCVPANTPHNPRLVRRCWGGAYLARVILRQPRFSRSEGVCGAKDHIRSTEMPGPKLLTFPLQLAQIGARFGVPLLTRLLVKLFGAPLILRHARTLNV